MVAGLSNVRLCRHLARGALELKVFIPKREGREDVRVKPPLGRSRNSSIGLAD